MKDHFNGHIELQGKINGVTIDEQVQQAIEYQTWLDEGNKKGVVGDPTKNIWCEKEEHLTKLALLEVK